MAEGSSPPARVASQTSALTGDGTRRDALKNQHTLNQGQLAGGSLSADWTDEKHSLYLKSMEVSFINDLYNSFDFPGWCTQVDQSLDHKLTGRKHTMTQTSTGQFKVLRGGCWGKVDFERSRSSQEKADISGVLLANPWIQLLRTPCRHQPRASSTFRGKSAVAIDLSGDNSLEVTDQNFVDEEDTGHETNHGCGAKRIKSSIAPTRSNDQVVPSAKFTGSADFTDQLHV